MKKSAKVRKRPCTDPIKIRTDIKLMDGSRNISITQLAVARICAPDEKPASFGTYGTHCAMKA
jgi:hypothetical protein